MSAPANPSFAFPLSRGVLTAIQPPIPYAKAWASEYPATPARPLINASQGVPGIPPPTVLLDAIGKASASPQNAGYCHGLGEPKLRAVFAQEMKVVYGKTADITAEDIAITAGCNMSFVAVITCLADAGDEVILPVPWYFNHSMTLDLLSIKPVPLYTCSDRGFLPSVDECKKLITSRTKAIILVSPNNPTGAIYSPALLAQFSALAGENNIALIIDETYRDFVEHFPPHDLFSPAQTETLPSSWSWRSTIIHLFSFSKSYSIPGHRLGLVAASPDFLKRITTVLDCIQICPPRPPQLALADPSLLAEIRQSFIQPYAEVLRARHDLFRRLLPPGWTIGSHGGYYAFVRHPFEFKNSTATGVEFYRRLATELGVLVLPCEFFYRSGASPDAERGLERWMRFSVASVSDEEIVSVCERLKECEAHFGSQAVLRP